MVYAMDEARPSERHAAAPSLAQSEPPDAAALSSD